MDGKIGEDLVWSTTGVDVSRKIIDARWTLNTDQWREADWITRILGCP
jgi:hypothetical protein